MDSPQKNYDFLEYTTSLCPECLNTVPGKIVARDGRVYIKKQCVVHGRQEELLEDNAAYFIRRNEFSRPGSACELQSETDKGCPFDCGLCPDHEQHTCIGLIEVNTGCDMCCPTCYAEAGRPGELSLPMIQRMIDFYIASEYGNAEILQLSGGEPTLHPQILDVLAYARNTKLAYVMLNTNGLRIAKDEAFVQELGRLVGNFEVYLQFDGLDGNVSKQLRGQDFLREKLRAVELLEKYNVPTTPVMTVQAGVNDHQIGDVVAFAMRHRNIRGVNFQPMAFFGRRSVVAPPKNRATLTGILQKIETQTAGLVKAADFAPLPCNVDRVAVTFLYRKQGSYIPVTRGILTTIYAMPLPGVKPEAVTAALETAYGSEVFIRLQGDKGAVELKNVAHSNFIDIAWRHDPRTGRIILMSAEENLIKGAAGQAVQNMNAMCGWSEQTAL